MSTTQINNLKKQKAYAWGRYYDMVNQQIEMAQHIVQLVGERENGHLVRPDVLPTHITEAMWEMANKLNETYSCPVCYDLTTKETFHLTWCGHILCATCYETLKDRAAPSKPKCPTCRKSV